MWLMYNKVIQMNDTLRRNIHTTPGAAPWRFHASELAGRGGIERATERRNVYTLTPEP